MNSTICMKTFHHSNKNLLYFTLGKDPILCASSNSWAYTLGPPMFSQPSHLFPLPTSLPFIVCFSNLHHITKNKLPVYKMKFSKSMKHIYRYIHVLTLSENVCVLLKCLSTARVQQVPQCHVSLPQIVLHISNQGKLTSHRGSTVLQQYINFSKFQKHTPFHIKSNHMIICLKSWVTLSTNICILSFFCCISGSYWNTQS